MATVPDNAAAEHRRDLPIEPPTEPAGFRPAGEAVLSSIVRRSELRIERLAHAAADRAQLVLQSVNARLETRLASVQRSRFLGSQATLLPVEPHALTTAILQSIDDRHVIDSLRDTYNAAFAGHHPEYERECCVVVSGSSRTALGLLGFHCGIREVVIPDLSWTYEHCFPSVHAVPLTPVFGLNIEAIMQMVESRLTADPNWREQSAVVLNNPHNATGRVFNPADVRRLLHWLLERNVWVIDDLSYHQVAPVDALPEIPTLRQHANELVAAGRITSAQSARLISVHSMSKTDCLAGARLSVVEIRDAALRERFCVLNDTIIPNIGALLLTTLFYRNGLNVARAYWRLRNSIFADRMEAISDALRQLPPDRNMFAIDILPPAGSMYPLMHINRLPAGLSLDWIAAGLARQGIGMIPLSTFARTEQGFETGRKAFRLTLGGTDGADVLRSKTRRVLIDLNRLIAEEEAHYRKRRFLVRTSLASDAEVERRWRTIEERLTQATLSALLRVPLFSRIEVNAEHRRRFLERYLPQRLETFKQRAIDQDHLAREWMLAARGDRARGLIKTLEQEFYKDDLRKREDTFQHRLFDRTVHPTQMYSLQAETAMNGLLAAIQRADSPRNAAVEEAARMLVREYFGLDVAITSGDEAQEVILDIDAQIQAELFAELQGANFAPSFLSFWGDWDGSNRPSGQGHRLVASVLIENVRRMSRFLVDLSARDAVVRIEPGLRAELERLPYNTRRFLILLNEITTLTHQLERRYRGVLPYQFDAGRMRRIATRLKVVRDPVTSLWHHNDRLERRMLELRRKRIEAMEYYFALNKRVRKSLHQWIPRLAEHTTDDPLLCKAVTTRDLLKRFVLTPRIHQNMVTAQDPFAIDTTVFNINEINAVAARSGNPGMVLALQLSMSTKPDALIALDRKMRARREQILRDRPDATLPSIRLVPLFEDSGSVRDLGSYLEKVWEYALQSRRMDQRTNERFAEVISEVFIAGSDLSQQVGQAPGAQLYCEAKLQLHLWLAKRHLADSVRLKMGSGEPM
ncbi:MAG: pyridoxal phosphate-dependent aminotransferase, partial [Bacteroidetes bacterium]|nr:pyridoxal phosphate-dependent aminotransferase [Bacteroidota bacterium]